MSLCEYKYRNMSYGGITGAPATGVQARKYGGKELDRENGLDWLDSQARMYDPLTGRTPTMDPMSEKYYHLSPYLWCSGNPVRNTDPTGEVILSSKDRKLYPCLYDYLSSLSQIWDSKDDTYKESFRFYSNIGDSQIKRILKNGSGPIIKVSNANLAFEGKEVNALTGGKREPISPTKGKLSFTITLSKEVVKMLEKAVTEEEKAKAMLMLESTLFHEFVHVGNYIYTDGKNGDRPQEEKLKKDSGKEFEQSVYGDDVNRSNLDEIFEKLNER